MKKIVVIFFLLISLSLPKGEAQSPCGSFIDDSSYSLPFNESITDSVYTCEPVKVSEVYAYFAAPKCSHWAHLCPGINNPSCGTGSSCELDVTRGRFVSKSKNILKKTESGSPDCNGKTKYIYTVSILNIREVECYCKCCPLTRQRKAFFSDNGSDFPSCIPGCPWTCDPFLVELDGFIATPQRKGILLGWKTASEVDSQGFKIWRGIPDLSKHCGCSTNIKDYKQVTMITIGKKGEPSLIPAKGSKTSGAEYSYLDEDVKPGIPYCYGLEDIDSNGESKFYFEYISFTPDEE